MATSLGRSEYRAIWLAERLNLRRPVQIADVGARLNRKPPLYYELLSCKFAHLHAFEPEREAFERLQDAKTEQMSVYPYALGKPGKAIFYAHKIGSISSVYKLAASSARFLGKGFWINRPIDPIEMKLETLDMIAGLPNIEILKMDAQGAELDIMKGGSMRLAECVMVIPEVRFFRMYEDEPLWADLDKEMRTQGFELHRFIHQKSVVLGSSQRSSFHKRAGSQLLDGDAVYIRNAVDPSKLSNRQLKVLALAAGAMIGSHDLCAYCLDELSNRGVVSQDCADQYVSQLPVRLLADTQH